MKPKIAIVVAASLLGACGHGGGLSGDYGRLNAASGRWDTQYSFKGDRVEIELLGSIEVGTYKLEDGKVYMTFGNQTQAFRFDERGCIAGGPLYGTACKKG